MQPPRQENETQDFEGRDETGRRWFWLIDYDEAGNYDIPVAVQCPPPQQQTPWSAACTMNSLLHFVVYVTNEPSNGLIVVIVLYQRY